MNSKKKAGLILSSIGEIIYLFVSIMLIGFTAPFSILPFSTLITGAISVVGTIVGKKEIKIGGAIILISIPISIVFILILSIMVENIPFSFNDIVLFLFVPIPYPHSVFVIIGGFLCLTSFDD